MNGGYIRVNRKVFEHKVFKKNEPYSEILAWVDLISRASYKDDIIRFNQFTKKVKRGELVVSPKYLALKWSWHTSKVRRFLDRLAFATMIGIVTDEGISRITIVNYEEYQHSTKLQAKSQAQLCPKSDTILNKEINNKYIYSQSFSKWWELIPHKMRKGKGKAYKSFKNIKSTLTVEELALRYKKSHELNKEYTKHPATWLNQECWLDDEVQNTTNKPNLIERMKKLGYIHRGSEGNYEQFKKDNKNYKHHKYKADAVIESD